MNVWDQAAAAQIIASYRDKEGALLPLLHALQEAQGYIHADAIGLIADALNISRAEVHGVVTFYHDFRREPPPALVVRLCRAEACQACGGREAAEHLLSKLGLTWDEPSRNGALVIEAVYCLGLCAVAPAAMIGADLLADFDGDALHAAVSAAT